MIPSSWQARRGRGTWCLLGSAGVGLAALAMTAGCGDETAGPPSDPELMLQRFPLNHPQSGHYELWISFAQARVPGARASTFASAGTFRTGETGQPVGLDGEPARFEIDPSDEGVPQQNGRPAWALAVDAFVTVEPTGDPEPETPGARFLGGSFQNGAASLDPGYVDALGESFAGASGTFLLATPSTIAVSGDSSGAMDETQGVWFALPGGSGPSLSLPALPAEWEYEGWVFDTFFESFSLGRFTEPVGADSDSSGPFHGMPPTNAPGYGFPGSDFPFQTLGEPIERKEVFVTVEPAGNVDGDAPFPLRVLTGAAPDSAIADSSLPLLNGSADFPTGTLTIHVEP